MSWPTRPLLPGSYEYLELSTFVALKAALKHEIFTYNHFSEEFRIARTKLKALRLEVKDATTWKGFVRAKRTMRMELLIDERRLMGERIKILRKKIAELEALDNGHL